MLIVSAILLGMWIFTGCAVIAPQVSPSSFKAALGITLISSGFALLVVMAQYFVR